MRRKSSGWIVDTILFISGFEDILQVDHVPLVSNVHRYRVIDAMGNAEVDVISAVRGCALGAVGTFGAL